MASLNLFVLDESKRKDYENDLSDYFMETLGCHDIWTLQLLFGQSLYLINIAFQIFFTDLFLGYEFSNYGVQAASFIEQAVS